MKLSGKLAVEKLFNGEKVLVRTSNGTVLEASSLNIQCFIDEKTRYLAFSGEWREMALEFYECQLFDAERWLYARQSEYPLVECCTGSAHGWENFKYHPRFNGKVLQHGDLIGG